MMGDEEIKRDIEDKCILRHQPITSTLDDMKKMISWIYTFLLITLAGIATNLAMTVLDRGGKSPTINVIIDKQILRQVQ